MSEPVILKTQPTLAISKPNATRKPHAAAHAVIITLLALVSTAHAVTYTEKNLPERREIVLIEPDATTQQNQDGDVVLASAQKPVTVLLPAKATPLLKMAADDLRLYLNLATQAHIAIATETDSAAGPPSGTVICLGHLTAQPFARPRAEKDPASDAFEIQCRTAFPTPDVDTIWIDGSSDRATFYGANELVRRTLNARWLPPRVYPGTAKTAVLETQLTASQEVRWPSGTMRVAPQIAERGCYFATTYLVPPTIDWLVRNRINIITLSTGRLKFPLPPDEERHLQSMIAQVHACGIKVLMINFTHNISEESKKAYPEAFADDTIDPTSPVTKRESVKLYVDLVKRYDLDGMAWHAASEGVKIKETAALASKPRWVWEAEYHQAYREAIRNIKPDAQLIRLMGWLYTSSAERMAEYFPKDTIAWIVPNTPVIDAANTDIDAFSKHFYCRYWLYSTVSKDAQFPVPKIDYFEPYVREAVKRKHGLMPQSVFCANTLNLQYLADAGWDGPTEATSYSRQFAHYYFAGVESAGRGFDLYTQITTRYRDWVNNLQTRPVKIKPEEFETLQAAEKAFRDAYQAAPTPLIRDRIRDYAISTVRAFKRYPRLRPAARLKALTATQSLCGIRPIDPEHDFFGRILREEMQEATQATTRPASRPSRPSAQTGASSR